jgi:hypothetical protein
MRAQRLFAEDDSGIFPLSSLTCTVIFLFGHCFGSFRHCWTVSRTGNCQSFHWTTIRNSVLQTKNFCCRWIGWTTYDLTKSFFSYDRSNSIFGSKASARWTEMNSTFESGYGSHRNVWASEESFCLLPSPMTMT